MLAASLALLFSTAAQSNVFFGNLHSHTSYSDGSGTPEEAFVHARDVAGLDFLAITEHSHKAAEGSGEKDPPGALVHIARNAALYTGPQADGLIPTAARINTQGGFVALYGQEFSSISKGNHVNVFEVGNVIDEAQVPNGDFKKLHTWLGSHPDSASKPALLQFNHPALHDTDANEYGRDDFGSASAWLAAMGGHAGLIEILNGPALSPTTGHRAAEVMESDYLTYLNRGFHLAPTADQDNHFRTWGSTTDARTAVIAPALTKAAILEALRERHVYASEDKNLRLVPTVNGHLIGTSTGAFPSVGIELAITLEIADDDEPNASYRIDVFSDDQAGGGVAQIAETFTQSQAGTFQLPGVSFTGPGQYVFLRVTQTTQVGEDSERDRAWTAPVWFEAGSPTVSPVLAVHIDSIVPNPAGSDLEFEEATIHNIGTAPVDMAGWTLRDKTGNSWSLNALGIIAPGAMATIERHGQAMAMNNSGDEVIELVSPTNAVVDEIRYNGATTGQVIPHAAP